MGMEPTDTYKEVEAEVTYMYQSPLWVWNYYISRKGDLIWYQSPIWVWNNNI